jgi:hypothetical protein
MGKPAFQGNDPGDRRRSIRVNARIPVIVRLQRANLRTVTQQAEALVINAHGALLLLAVAVSEDEILTLVNSGNGEEVVARVTSLGATFMGKAEVAIEFIKPTPEFWRVTAQAKQRV